MVTGGGERGVGGSLTPPASAHQPGPRGACVRGCRAQELQACLGAQGNHSVGWNQLWGLGSPGLSFPFLTLQGYFCPLHRPTLLPASSSAPALALMGFGASLAGTLGPC